MRKEEILRVLIQRMSQNQGLRVYFYDEEKDKAPVGITFYHDEVELLIEVIKQNFDEDLNLREGSPGKVRITEWKDYNC